jgi:cytochrome c biogenesis protein
VVERSTVNRLVVGSSPTWGVYNIYVYYKFFTYCMTSEIHRILWKGIYALGNLRLAIVLLLFIAAISSLGTIIEQEKTISFYETNYPISNPIAGFIHSDFILFFGLNHVYTTSWFLILLFLFGGSLLSCTFSRQIPSLKLARLWKFFKRENGANKMGISFSLSNGSLAQFSYLLRQKNYNVIQQGPYIYAYKGLVGKIGPILVHLSIICILIGSILGALTGFMLQELVPKGELFHLQNIISSGPLSYIRQDFEGYIHDFNIAYNDQGIVDQFYSEIDILDNDLEIKKEKTIFVNEPLRYSGVTFYQTDWSIVNLKFTLNEEEYIDIPLREITGEGNSRFWIGSLDYGTKNKLILVLQDLTGKYLLYNSEKRLLGQSEIGHKVFFNGNELRLNKILPSTGLQIKSDPGIPLVYIGFFFLIFSVLLSYTSYFQIWVVKKQNKVYVYGDTNRAIYFFEKTILEIINNLQNDSIRFKRPIEF